MTQRRNGKTKNTRRSSSKDKTNRKPDRRTPLFSSGVLEEPLLLFGGKKEHVDPKTGLALYGPYSLAGQSRPILSGITVGVIGTSQMIGDAEAWLEACKSPVENDGSQPFLYPGFPGFSSEHPFQCDLIYGPTWQETLPRNELKEALKTELYYDRIRSVIGVYLRAIEVLAGRDPRPDVILCCIPQDVIKSCTAKDQLGKRQSKGKKKKPQDTKYKQLSIFEIDGELGIEGDENEHQNLRRGIKAEAMKYGIPTQLVWPRTLDLTNRSTGRRAQDIATRAWNFSTALYHKAGGCPWRVDQIEHGTCYVGISFYRELFGVDSKVRTSMAQAFTAAGDGYVLRGTSFEWDEAEGKSPHMDYNTAASLMQDVIALYKKQSRGSLPSRIVVHKSSRFWEEELQGLEEASEMIPSKDFIALGRRGIQFYRKGDYPALRGTYVKYEPTNYSLYTVGYIPYLRTYPGARVPQPLEILEHIGDSPWTTVLREILTLTKMNWNTADFSCTMPVTVAFSQKVGQVLAELPEGGIIRPEYRYYM